MPNQINEDELQKAIDDITSSAQNNADAGEMPAPEVPAAAPVPEVAPEVAGVAPDAAAAPVPDLGVPPMPPVPPTPGAFDPSTVAPLGEAAPVPPMPVPEMPPMGEAPAPEAPAPEAPAAEPAPMIAPPEGTPEAVVAPEAMPAGEVPAPEAPGEMPAPEAPVVEAGVDAGANQIKADILRDLSPLMDKVQIEPEKKFHIYRDMMTTNNDKTVIPSAYETAKLIDDEQKRGEALVSLIDAIDS